MEFSHFLPFFFDRPDVRLVRLVRAAGVGRPEELGKPAGESHRMMIEEDPTADTRPTLAVRGGITRDTAVSTPMFRSTEVAVCGVHQDDPPAARFGAQLPEVTGRNIPGFARRNPSWSSTCSSRADRVF